MSSARKIVLVSSDKELFEVEEAVALESQTIKDAMEDVDANADRHRIPLPNVSSKILSKVIEYCRKHVDTSRDLATSTSRRDRRARRAELKAWDAEFVKVDQETLYDLIMAANYLNIKGLQDLTCQTVADMIKGKEPKEIMKILNIKKEGRTNGPWSIFARAKWGRCIRPKINKKWGRCF